MAEGATLVAADETGLSQVPTVVRTWARRGRTPRLRHPFNWKKLSALVLLTHRGAALCDIVPGAFTADRVLLNLKALLATIPGRIVLLLDNASIHRSRAIREWLEEPAVAARLEIAWLPPYAPELNPVELLFSSIKRVELGNHHAEDLGALEHRFRAARQRAAHANTKSYFDHALGVTLEQRQEVA